MERFKACEKEMKTKAYSKEGLSVTRLDPKEREKMEMGNFITSMIDDLDRQVEQLEAEVESLQATAKRGKKDSAKAERIAETEYRIEQHKWHQGKLEVILRLLENGNLETDQVAGIQEDIKYYVESNQDVDFADDDEMYDSLNLEEEEELYGMNDNDHLSSQDTHSVHEEEDKKEVSVPSVPLLIAKKAESTGVRKPSMKATAPPPVSAAVPLPHSSSAGTASLSSTSISSASMKPAPVPTRPAGEGLKYASAAAAAATATPGLAPLPPPPTSAAAAAAAAAATKIASEKAPAAPALARGSSAASSPALSSATMATSTSSAWQNGTDEKSESTPAVTTTPTITNAATSATKLVSAVPPPVAPQRTNTFNMKEMKTELKNVVEQPLVQNVSNTPDLSETSASTEESIFHLPSGLRSLISGFDAAKDRVLHPPAPEAISKMVDASFANCPEAADANKPIHYHPKTPFPTSPYFPQEPLAIFDDPLLYEKVEIDTLFYVFYYRQGTYQQHLAAQELKKQSWRFHKKFLTWFQRHEEPKIITDEYEQGTYRYFDFEGTWLQRRKANFEFEYQYLEDEI